MFEPPLLLRDRLRESDSDIPTGHLSFSVLALDVVDEIRCLELRLGVSKAISSPSQCRHGILAGGINRIVALPFSGIAVKGVECQAIAWMLHAKDAVYGRLRETNKVILDAAVLDALVVL